MIGYIKKLLGLSPDDIKPTMTDNFEKIEKILDWSDKDKFYFLSIIQRKKDARPGDKVKGTNNNSRMVKAYYVNNEKYLRRIKKEVIELCKLFNARACINLNRRSYEKIAYQHLKLVTDNIMNKNFDKIHKTHPSAVGKYAHEKDKKWIIDLDGKKENSEVYVYNILKTIKGIQPEGDKFIEMIPSKSGNHIIAKPFNLQKFREVYPNITVQKNSPTNLYIP